MHKTLQKQLDEFFRDVTSLGSFAFFLLVTVLFIVSPLFPLLLFGLIFTAAIVIIIRLFYFKDRPKKEENTNFIERIDASSFPSLHAARIAFLAALFISQFNNDYLTIILILMAALVSYSRIYLRKHDWIDVAVGIIVGVVTFFIASFLL